MSQSLNGHNLDILIRGCLDHDRNSQKLLYKLFFNYGMSICMRYTRNREDAREVLNDSFMKVFVRINQYNNKYHFKSWFGKITINCSLDYIKKELKNKAQVTLEESLLVPTVTHHENFNHEELLGYIQQLSPAYRSVFNLYVIDGYNHEDISKMLGISVGTSKSNLSKARMRLREILLKIDKDEYARFAG